MPAEKRQPAAQVARRGASPSRGAGSPQPVLRALWPPGHPSGQVQETMAAGTAPRRAVMTPGTGQARRTGTWTGAPRVRTDSGQPTDY